jgi:hypothetical protein
MSPSDVLRTQRSPGLRLAKGYFVTKISTGLRSVLLFALATLMLVLDVNSAYAQAAQCAQLQNALAQFNSNGDFQRFGSNPNMLRQLQRQVQDSESRYIRRGCNDDARAGRQLNQECQGIARDVLKAREDLANASQGMQNATAVAQQREAILQEMARFGCAANTGMSGDRQSLFDRIFGTSSEQDFTNGDFVDGGWGYAGYNTVRTLCVRLTDGYFWPISYSTLPDYLANDAQACQQMCPNTPVDLFYYNNPGEEPEQMRNTGGIAYSAMPYAFAYREKFDNTSSCKAAPSIAGAVKVASTDGGQELEMMEINGVTFPMPRRDPRGIAPVQAAVQPEMLPVQAVAMVDIPLPRPRPSGPGEIARRPEAPAPQELRIVNFDGKAVRVVGPDTPYAQAGRSGS